MITSWEFLSQTDLPIIVYGMGNGADKIIDALNERGVEISGVIASDGFVRGQSFRGHTVKTLRQTEQLYENFVIVLAFASSLPDVMSHIISVSERHKTLVPSVPVFGGGVFDLSFAKAHHRELTEAYNCLSDEKSKKTYENIVSFLLTGDLKTLISCQQEKDEAFNKILKLSKDEVYFDLGAYRGDTIEEFLHFSNNSCPPDEAFGGHIKKLEASAGGFKNTVLLREGIWSDDAVLNFSGKAGRNSSLAPKGTPTEVTSIDRLTERTGLIPTYIKADVEGAELEMLNGAVNTLSQYKPKLNIALYHRTEDIFKLILKVKEINPRYKLHIRHHPYIPFWDTNL